MQMLATIDYSAATPIAPCAESQAPAEVEFAVIQMRALRRKARRISAYARWSATMLNTLAAQVETDIASLQH
jgi:hypothetical protein